MTNPETKVVRFHETGGASVLQIDSVPLAEPGTGEVRLRVEALGLNRAEVMFREGQYLEAPTLPSRLGYEAAGVVDAVGAEVEGVAVGDRVSTIPAFSMGTHGVYGESAIVPATAVASYPEALTAAQGTSIWMQYLTAFGALIEHGKLSSGQTVLITAASSSVGIAAIQIAKSVGATAIATTRGAAKKQGLLDAGADHVVVTDDEDLAEAVSALTDGNGAQLVFDPIGGPGLEALANATASGGTIFEYGALSTEPTPYPLFAALGKGLSIRGYTLFEISGNPERLARGKSFVYEGLASGALSPQLAERRFTLAEIAEAHRYMEANTHTGKIVVTV
ncbi:MAG: zinc-dependent alcohol dehydrogenase family protein [Nannocystales bacterium]